MSTPHHLAIVGVGLIGGSLARALREAGYFGRITGTGKGKETLRRAVELGVIDDYDLDVAAAVAEADTIVVAVPLGAMGQVFRQLAGAVRDDAVITDVGSSKASVVAEARAAFGRLPSGFVPGHPIAGTERSGVEASFATLYQNRRVILTPVEESDEQAIAAVTAMWQAAGAEVEHMSVEHHDEVLAATSHLPHMLAFVLVDALARMKDKDEIFRYAAGGFRDFTRIASSDPVMWRDVCLANSSALLKMIDSFSNDLNLLRNSIESQDAKGIHDMFVYAKAARDRYADGEWPSDMPGGEN